MTNKSSIRRSLILYVVLGSRAVRNVHREVVQIYGTDEKIYGYQDLVIDVSALILSLLLGSGWGGVQREEAGWSQYGRRDRRCK